MEVNALNFEKEVLLAKDSVLVDFWAEWCAPCKMLAPVLEGVTDKIKIAKVNVDDQPELAIKYGINSIPALLLFRNGKEEKRIVGFHSLPEIEEFIK